MRITAAPFELNPATRNDPAKVDQVARQLEGQFAQMLIKSMREASFGDSLFPGENPMFRDMYDKQLAEQMTKGRGLGLSAIIARQLGGSKENENPTLNPSINPVDAAKRYQLSAPAPTGLPLGDVMGVGALPVNSLSPSAHVMDPAQLPLAQTLDLIAGRDSSQLHKQLELGATADALSPPPSAGLNTNWAASNDRWSGVAMGSGDDAASAAVNPIAANVAAAKLGANSPEGFVASIWPYAQKAAKELGVNPRALVAQAALETGWGKRNIQRQDGSSANNLFGIKATGWRGDSATTTTHEYVAGVRRTETASFRSYASIGESFSDYVRLLKNNARYSNALQAGTDTRSFARGLQQGGYATDPAYANKIAAIADGPTVDRAVAAISDASTQLERNFATTAGLPGVGVTRR
jgi:flagellar protein FlgJ